MTRYADLLAALLEDPHTDRSIRGGAAHALGRLGLKEMLPLLYQVAQSEEVPPEAYRASLYDGCIQAMFWIAARNGFIDGPKYHTHPVTNVNTMCKRWWDETQPTEQVILAWSRGEHPS